MHQLWAGNQHEVIQNGKQPPDSKVHSILEMIYVIQIHTWIEKKQIQIHGLPT